MDAGHNLLFYESGGVEKVQVLCSERSTLVSVYEKWDKSNKYLKELL